MGVRRNSLGPLLHSNLVQIESVVLWEKTMPPKIAADSTDEPYLVTMADRHDHLAFRRMGTSQHGWVIMERNSVQRPTATRIELDNGRVYGGEDTSIELSDMRLWPNDFVPGRTIGIPSRDGIRLRGISR